jgi:predicted DNA-binding protein (MmcQ/YjbR family)
MNLEQLRTILLNKKGTTEERPFGPDTLVFKVIGKMFALCPADDPPPSISLKCDPDQALFLRDLYPAVKPGYHLNKQHWNTVLFDGTVPDLELLGMIDDSYDLVVRGLTRAQKQQLVAQS